MIKEAENVCHQGADTAEKLPERITLRVISPKKRSTKLSQEEEVGVRCKWKRG